MVRLFKTGATRDSDESKLDYEGFLSPLVLERYARYMHSHRVQPDGKLRDSDNWQKGIPIFAYMKSMWRHFFSVWRGYRDNAIPEEELCALLFNAMGMLHEVLKVNETKYMDSNENEVVVAPVEETTDEVAVALTAEEVTEEVAPEATEESVEAAQ